MLLFLSVALLSAPLLIQMIEERRTGQNRPLEYPVAPQVRKAVKEYISNWPEVEIITQSRNSVEPEAGITIILLSEKNISPDFEEGLIRAVQKARGDEAIVRIIPVLSARQSTPANQSIEK